MHEQLDVDRKVEFLLRIPIPRGGGHARSPYHLHHAIVVVVVFRTYAGEYGMHVLKLIVGEVASVVDILDEPRGRGWFDANDGRFGIEVCD